MCLKLIEHHSNCCSAILWEVWGCVYSKFSWRRLVLYLKNHLICFKFQKYILLPRNTKRNLFAFNAGAHLIDIFIKQKAYRRDRSDGAKVKTIWLLLPFPASEQHFSSVSQYRSFIYVLCFFFCNFFQIPPARAISSKRCPATPATRSIWAWRFATSDRRILARTDAWRKTH